MGVIETLIVTTALAGVVGTGLGGLVGAIRVECCQHIGVLRSKWWHMVDGTSHVIAGTIRTERHIAGAFGLCHDGHTFLAIAQG